VEQFRERPHGRHCRRPHRRALPLEIGDRIPSNDSYGGALPEFNLDGIYHSERPRGSEKPILVQWKYFDEMRPAPVRAQRWYVVKLNSPRLRRACRKAIDEKFANFPLKPRPRRIRVPGWFRQAVWKHRALILTIGPRLLHILLVTGNTMPSRFANALASLPCSGHRFSGRAVLFFSWGVIIIAFVEAFSV